MLEGGCMQTHVANVLGVSQSVVSRAWIKYYAFGTGVRRHAGGRKRATTHRKECFIALWPVEIGSALLGPFVLTS